MWGFDKLVYKRGKKDGIPSLVSSHITKLHDTTPRKKKEDRIYLMKELKGMKEGKVISRKDPIVRKKTKQQEKRKEGNQVLT